MAHITKIEQAKVAKAIENVHKLRQKTHPYLPDLRKGNNGLINGLYRQHENVRYPLMSKMVKQIILGTQKNNNVDKKGLERLI